VLLPLLAILAYLAAGQSCCWLLASIVTNLAAINLGAINLYVMLIDLDVLLIDRSCCAVLCCAVLCCAVLCCAVLCCAVLCCAVLCCAVMYYAVLCCAVSISLCCAFNLTVLLPLLAILAHLPPGQSCSWLVANLVANVFSIPGRSFCSVL
jgi:hypothetical protein